MNTKRGDDVSTTPRTWGKEGPNPIFKKNEKSIN
jgi:hypothetical protein